MDSRRSIFPVLPRLFSRAFRIAAACGLVFVGAAVAHAASTFTTELTATKRVLTKDAGGREVESWVAFTKLLPGELVTYTIACTNHGAEPAAGIVVSLPIPAEMTVIVPSEQPPGIDFACSIDGGKSFGPLDRLTVVAPDGASRPALAADINFVRWTLTAPLAPATTTAVSCRAVLK